MRADTPADTFENREQSAYLEGAVERRTHPAANAERRYTLEDYLELDRTSEERLEFGDGEIFCMTRLYKQADGLWIHTEVNELEATLTLTSLGCERPLIEVYADVNFDRTPDN